MRTGSWRMMRNLLGNGLSYHFVKQNIQHFRYLLWRRNLSRLQSDTWNLLDKHRKFYHLYKLHSFRNMANTYQFHQGRNCPRKLDKSGNYTFYMKSYSFCIHQLLNPYRTYQHRRTRYRWRLNFEGRGFRCRCRSHPERNRFCIMCIFWDLKVQRMFYSVRPDRQDIWWGLSWPHSLQSRFGSSLGNFRPDFWRMFDSFLLRNLMNSQSHRWSKCSHPCIRNIVGCRCSWK